MKKILSILLIISFVMGIVSTSAFSFTVGAVTSGDYTYELVDGNAVITGVNSTINGSVVLPKTLDGHTVSAIGNNAFYGCDAIVDITVPSGVVSIGEGAFAFCKNLEFVSLPNSVTVIGMGAFSDCEKLVDLSLPKTIETIGAMAFSNCVSITSVDIPDSVTQIGEYAFGWCTNLVSARVGYNVSILSEGVFFNCAKLDNVTGLSNVVTIDKQAFYGCESLQSFNIPNSVTKISAGAFEGCANLEEVYMPNTVTYIGSCAFLGCEKLSTVWFVGEEEEKSNIDIYTFNDCLLNAEWHCDLCDPDDHKYADDCFDGCTECGWVPKTHTYSNNCDISCNNCSQSTREIIPHSYDECFDGYVEQLYKSWSINITETGVYSFNPKSNFLGNFTIHNIALLDKNGKAIKYNKENGGFPLVAGQRYTIKFRYNCSQEIDGNVTWEKTYITDTIFTDTDATAWYNDAVTYSVGAGIITGYGGTNNFGTADKISRHDFVVILARFAGVDLSVYDDAAIPFKDVPDNQYYTNAILWAAESGITSGYTSGVNAGKFGVGDEVTREQLVTFLYRYAKNTNGSAPEVSDGAAEKAAAYPDFAAVGSYAKDPVIWALDKGVIAGQGGTHIAPGGNALRCEVAKIFYNIFLNGIF